MTLSAVVLLCLLASSAGGAAVKGGRADEFASKGGRPLLAPLERQRELPKTTEPRELSKVSEQRREEAPLHLVQVQQTKLEDLQQQREEPPAQLEQQPKGGHTARYEARPQIRDEPAYEAKGQRALPTPAAKADQLQSDAPAQQQQQKEEQSRLEFLEPQRELPSKTNHQAPDAAPAKTQQRAEDAKGQAAQRQEAAEERREDQAQYAVQLAEEQRPLRTDESQGKRAEEQQEQYLSQQQVDLTKQDYEQRLLDGAQVQQRHEEQQWVQVEQQAIKGGVKSPVTGLAAEAEPYAFDYSVEGSSRRESGDANGVVRGRYTIRNPDGSQRVVDYVADRDGFRAQVDTNEFGTENQQPASVALSSSQPAAQDISLRLEGKTREALLPPQVLAAPPAIKTQYAEYSQSKVTVEESSRLAGAFKGAAGPAKGRDEQLPLPPPQQFEAKAPRPQPLPQLQQQREIEPQRSLELRAPKSLAVAAPAPAEFKSPVAQARAAAFESATAHRPIVRAAAPAVGAPSHHYHQRQPAAPSSATYLGRGHIASPATTIRNYRQQVSRAQLQHERYPPLRHEPLNPRASSYAASAEDEQPAGFDAS